MLGELISEGSATTKLLLHLNGNSTDSSGNSNNGTDTAITYSQANGKFGQGAGFNGTNSRIMISNGLGINNGACTISMWAKLNAEITSGSWFFVNCENGSPYYVGNTIYYNYNSGTRTITFDRTRWGVVANTTGGSLTMGTSAWYHIVYSYDGANLSGYVNGSRIGTPVAASGNGNNNNITETNLGASNYNGTISSFINANIDEVIISNTAWSAAKIAKYYAFSKARWATI